MSFAQEAEAPGAPPETCSDLGQPQACLMHRQLSQPRNRRCGGTDGGCWSAAGVVALVTVVFAATTLRLIVFPPRDQPRHVNGIVSFNGPNEGIRTALALSLAEKGYAPVLLFSQGSRENDTACPKAPKISVVCFVDASGNTRGEAEWAGHYAERHHWHSLMLVPGRGQATRARLLTERCFSGQVTVVPTAGPRPPLSEIMHEWGGLFDAVLIHRGC